MPRYRYEAVDAAGEVVRDELDAATLDAAIARLRDQGLLPLTVNEAKSGFLRGGFGQPLFSKRRALSRKTIALLTQQLASLLHAGMPLDRALTILIGVTEDEQAQGPDGRAGAEPATDAASHPVDGASGRPGERVP